MNLLFLVIEKRLLDLRLELVREIILAQFMITTVSCISKLWIQV